MKSAPFKPKLIDLFRQKRFFELRDQIESSRGRSSSGSLFYQGAIANKFNQIKESVEFLQQYLKSANPTGERLRNCYELLGDNFAKSYEYQRAAEKFGWLMKNCSDAYTAEKRQNLEYRYSLWNAVKDTPAQTISFLDNTQIKADRTKSNYLQFPVEINGQKEKFIIDTGANLSCVSKSTARKFGLEIIDCDISVGTITDIRVNSKLAVAPKMRFGNVELENVIFFLFEDKELFLEKSNFQVNGVIGYPVLQACRQISVAKTDILFIPAEYTASPTAEQNLCFDDMMPLLNLTYKNQPMTFIFDSGCRKSQFWNKFLEFDKDEIIKSAKLKKTDVGGAGGRREIKAYIMDKIEFPVSQKNVSLEKSKVFSESINEFNRNFFGNIGQDFMMQFDKLTVDFVSSSVCFE